MMQPSTHTTLVLAGYCGLVLLASLAGGWLPLVVHLTHTRLQIAVSLVAGLMLGMALLHLIPHAAEQTGSLDTVVAWVLAGFLTMFFIQRFLHFHHHDLAEDDPEDCCHDDDGAHAGPEHPPHAHTLAAKSAAQLSWGGTALGLGLHSLLDGLALAASVTVGTGGHPGVAGMGTALVVILHKPFDAMAITTLMSAGGSSRALQHILNAAFALVTPLGVALFFLGTSHFVEASQGVVGGALAFVAGSFLCIACSDLLPELQFHSHDRIKLSLALLAGLAIAVLIGQFESSGHEHSHGNAAPVERLP